MKFWFVQIHQVNGDCILFKFESMEKALNFMWTLRENVFTEHVIISLLGEEDI